MPFGLGPSGERLLVLRVGEQRRIAGFAAVLVERIRVGRALVLERSLAKIPALEQHLGQEEVRPRRLDVVGERLQIALVPPRRGRVLGGVATILSKRMM